MRRDKLDGYLAEKFGAGPYMTSQDLTTSKNLFVIPRRTQAEDFTLVPSRIPTIDGIWGNGNILRGDPVVSLGEFPVTGDLLRTKAFIYLAVVKRAGQDEHRIPDQLQELKPIFQALADFQYSNSPFARSKICAISLRVLPIESGVPQIGNGWHIHKPYASMENLLDRMSFYRSTEESAKEMGAASVSLMQTESYFSTQHSTLVQTSPTLKDLDLVEGVTELKIKANFDIGRYLPNRQLKPFEAVVGSGHTYHTPSIPQDNGGGAYRLFMKHLYIPTTDTELLQNPLQIRLAA